MGQRNMTQRQPEQSDAANGQIRVLLVDDHALLRAGLKLLISGHPGLVLAGETGNPEEAVKLAVEQRPDVVALDLDLGGVFGLDLIPELRRDAAGAKILVVTGNRDPEVHREAARRGASGLVSKDKAPEVFVKAILKVHEGEPWFDRSLIGQMIREMAGGREKQNQEAERIATLTAREREVIGLICEGLKNKVIADRLFISETTVRHHLTSIYSKLGVSDRLELVIYAYRYRLATPPA